jgi:PBSX family phage portal protein
MPVVYKNQKTRRRLRSRISTVPVVRKADTQLVTNQPIEYEDFFTQYYASQAFSGVRIIPPPYNPLDLKALVTRNNILLQCVHAYEVNIDGTGHTIELIEGKTENEKEQERLKNFFDEIYPGMSFMALRRQIRNDMESIGYGFAEVLRSLDGKLQCLRYVEASTVRLIRLDDAVQKKVTIKRDGADIQITIFVRERRYVQQIANKMVFYKPYQSVRELDRNTGQWAQDGDVVTAENAATELIMFGVERDVQTPYFVPRWINNIPSAIGSRKAEEYNLEFFDSGGLPPALIFLLGGTMGDTVRDQLLHYLSGRAKDKQRAAVVEAHSTSGSIDSGGGPGVNVKVERFGDSRGSDSMFQEYDKNTEDHVRVAFRLPTIFLGKESNYNFATAIAAILVAEAQVFQPERTAFDEKINKTIMRELGAENYEYKSAPMLIRNADLQMTALPQAKGMIKGEDFIKAINQITNLNLDYDQATVDEQQAQAQAQIEARTAAPANNGSQRPSAGTGSPQAGGGAPRRAALAVVKGDTASPLDIMLLADAWCEAIGIIKSEEAYSRQEVSAITKHVLRLTDDQRVLFDRTVAMRQHAAIKHDEDGMEEITDACCRIMSREWVAKNDPVVKQEVLPPQQPHNISINLDGIRELAEALTHTAQATSRAVQAMVVKEDKTPKIELKVDLQLPPKRATQRTITLGDGKTVVVRSEPLEKEINP